MPIASAAPTTSIKSRVTWPVPEPNSTAFAPGGKCRLAKYRRRISTWEGSAARVSNALASRRFISTGTSRILAYGSGKTCS